ncbi:X-linked retinitis pigmentosa GTPase regulator-like [Littorina saxatilis]|uniref:X-linked retinitis pigmentosa GTPase regulator-like n=1 Tax=Littorina saxatilis TaxID=31220 RepID=UPI0038B57B16
MAATDDSDIPESGAVFTFGKSKFAENLPNKFWVKNDRVLEVACGDEHTALVAESGRVFMFGPNDWGQLGVGAQKIANRPTCIKTLKHEKSKMVACGRLHTVVATESGNIYTFGSNSEGQLGAEGEDGHLPRHVASLDPTPYRMLAAGCDHSIALTEDARVFVWGGNGEGQLGLGEELEIPVPKQLDIGQSVTCISCGYYHSALVTENGELYTFGESDAGKLGLGENPDEHKTPQHVMSIADRVKTVSCGGSHTAAVTENGQLYTFGDGPNGQLGLGVSVLESQSPSLVKLPFKVSQVCCGENFTAIVSEKGQLYTFGDGRHGKLGLGQESFSNQFTPQKVDRFQKFVVTQVACGGCHMIVTAAPRLENGDVESEDEDVEEQSKLEKTLLNGSLRDSNELGLSRTFSARDRRRQASPLPLHRTLPALGSKQLPSLSATMPAIKIKSDKPLGNEPVPRLQRLERAKKIEKGSAGEDEESEEEESDEEEEEAPKPKVSPRKVPLKPSEANGDVTHASHHDSHKDGESAEEEEAEKEEGEGQSKVDKLESDKESDAEWSEVDEKANDADSETEDEKEDEKKREKEEGKRKEEEEEEGSAVEEEAMVDLKKMPKPLPEKLKEDKEDEDEEDEEDVEEDKKKDKKKIDKKKDEEDDEGEEKKKDKKKDKKDKDKKDKKKKGKKGEEDEEDVKEDEDEDEEKEEKGKKKGKDKKKGKEDKKKKKGKKDKDEEDDEDEKEEEEVEDTKSKKKDKEKDKKKKKKKGDKDEEEEEEEEETEKKEKEEEKEKKEEPAPKKKSRFCTVL